MTHEVDFKKLYLSLFGNISELTEEIAQTSPSTNQQAETFFLRLQQIMLNAEEQYLILSD